MRAKNSIQIMGSNQFSAIGETSSETVVFSTSDDIKISFIAPEFLYGALSPNRKHGFVMALGIGYLGFKNDSRFDTVPYILTGSTVGFKAGFSYDYHIDEHFAIGASANIISGALSNLRIESDGRSEKISLEDDERENLSRISLNAGIRFYL